MNTLDLLTALGYSEQTISQAEHIYILSEKGYLNLIKIMDTDLAWDVYNHLLHEYFFLQKMHQKTNSFAKINMQQVSPGLRFMKSVAESINGIVEQLMEVKIQRQQQDQKIAAIDQRMEDLCQIIAISPTEWRKETRDLIDKIAQARGNNYKGTYLEIFDLAEQRAGVSLGTRLNNKRRRIDELGVNATKCKSVTRIDVIADDKKLIEIYIALVKKVAIRYGVGVKK